MTNKPYIENTSAKAIETGTHTITPDNSILIRITEPGNKFNDSHYQFNEVHKFYFYDVDKEIEYDGQIISPITQDTANELVKILMKAFNTKMNVLVHCQTGLCRSGAVTEIGAIIGFNPVHNNRIPNVEVKSKMMKALFKY